MFSLMPGKSLSGKFPQTELNKQWKDIKESEFYIIIV